MHPCTVGRVTCLAIAILVLSSATVAQPKRSVTLEWIYSDSAAQVTATPLFVWLKSGTAILYDRRVPASDRTFEHFNPRSGERRPMLDASKAISSLRALLGNDAPRTLSWPIEFDGDGRQALYLFNNDLFLLDVPRAQFQRLTQSDAEEINPSFSPDGKQIGFVRSKNLFVYDIAATREQQLTFDTAATILNGTLSWVYWEEIFGRRDLAYWWSGDSKAIAFLNTDESPVGTMYYSDFKPWTPRVITQRYPKAGQPNPIVRLGIVELTDGKTTWMNLGNHSYEYIIRAKWLPSSDRVCLETMNRAQDTLTLHFINRASGIGTLVMHETDPLWVNIHDDLYFLRDEKHFLWASERDGYLHLYRFTIDGKLVNQVTKGPWAMRSSGGVFWVQQAVSAVDESSGLVYFTSLEKSNLEKQLYRIRMDGSGMQRLSSGDGTHEISFSPDARYYFDRFSNVSTPPSLTLYQSNGKLVRVLAEPNRAALEAFDVQYPKLLSVPASDGFPMPAQIVKPANFDSTKRYPIILYEYGGPSAPTVLNVWQGGNYFNQLLLQNGYLVATIDNRSATAISKRLENTVRDDLGGMGQLRDLLDGVRWLKSQPYVDSTRIGIWGWSGGGTTTLLAMTRSTEFKAGISGAPVTDMRFYDTKWAEASMKRPQDNAAAYDRLSLLPVAKNLHGRLLFIHGTYDDNVHIQNTEAFVEELIKAGKTVDMMIYPMRKHGFVDRPARIHRDKTMLEFWLKNL
jgi:dipeptidyl-peptidase-4